MIRLSTAVLLEAIIQSTYQSAHQADRSSPLNGVWETILFSTGDDHSLYFEGINVGILAGIPFIEYNDIFVRPAKRHLEIGSHYTYPYGSNSHQHRSTEFSVPLLCASLHYFARRVQRSKCLSKISFFIAVLGKITTSSNHNVWNQPCAALS